MTSETEQSEAQGGAPEAAPPKERVFQPGVLALSRAARAQLGLETGAC